MTQAVREGLPDDVPTGLHLKVRLAPSRLGGLGVFAEETCAAGGLVEACPVLPVSQVVREELPDRCVVLHPDDPETVGIPLGYGAMYNHASPANLGWEVVGTVMRLTAARDLVAGEELCIDYGAEWFDGRGLEAL